MIRTAWTYVVPTSSTGPLKSEHSPQGIHSFQRDVSQKSAQTCSTGASMRISSCKCVTATLLGYARARASASARALRSCIISRGNRWLMRPSMTSLRKPGSLPGIS